MQTRNDGRYATKALIATTGGAEITALCVKPTNGSMTMAYYAGQMFIASVSEGVQSVVEWPHRSAPNALACMGRWYWGASEAEVWAAELDEVNLNP